MMATRYARFYASLISFLIFLALCAPVWAQGPASKTGKGKAQSCDGAADIVPVKPASFARKRRPAPKEQAAEAKPAKQP